MHSMVSTGALLALLMDIVFGMTDPLFMSSATDPWNSASASSPLPFLVIKYKTAPKTATSATPKAAAPIKSGETAFPGGAVFGREVVAFTGAEGSMDGVAEVEEPGAAAEEEGVGLDGAEPTRLLVDVQQRALAFLEQ